MKHCERTAAFIPFLVFRSGKWGIRRNGDRFIY